MTKVSWIAAGLWLALNLMTLTGYPGVWVDEILLSDAGMHLAMGKGFVSSAWFNQPSWAFWAGYTPLYSFAVSGWLMLLGISAFEVRTFGLAMVIGSLAMIWRLLKPLQNDTARWTIILALAVCEPLAFLARAGRPDSVSLLLLAATALVFVEKSWRWRSGILWLLGALAIPAALQYTAGLLVVALLVHIWFKAIPRRDLMLWVTGVASGAGVLGIIYAVHHVLKTFIEVTLASKHSSAGRLLQNLVLGHGEAPFVLSDITTASFRDFATPVLIAGGVAIWLLARRQGNPAALKLSSFGLGCAISIPLAIQLLGKYPVYYTYMDAVPATVGVFAAGSKLNGRTRFVNVVLFALLLVGGAGRFWWKAWQQGTQTIAESAQLVSPADVLVADYPAYYQFVGRTRELFAIDYAGGKLMPTFPPSQAGTVTKLIVRDSRLGEVAKKVGGEWRRVGDVSLLRRGVASHLAVIDDDTRHPVMEALGIYMRSRK